MSSMLSSTNRTDTARPAQLRQGCAQQQSLVVDITCPFGSAAVRAPTAELLLRSAAYRINVMLWENNPMYPT
jgi:hypothetical protein